jgi:hypothetical protein
MLKHARSFAFVAFLAPWLAVSAIGTVTKPIVEALTNSISDLIRKHDPLRAETDYKPAAQNAGAPDRPAAAAPRAPDLP